jgi:hypothetical protein
MNPEHDLNELFDRELGRLPVIQAPRTLAPRVMAIVRAQAAAAEAPWWLQSWAQWPMYARAALFIVALLIASIFFSGSVVLDDQMRSYSPTIFSNLFGDFAGYGNMAGLLWQKIGQPLFLTRLAVCVAMYFVCIGLITAMYRVVTRETHS